MNNKEYSIRDYNSSDYTSCETLVSNAWKFEKNFKPQALADIAKNMYTMGSVISSNYGKVVIIDNQVVGFLLGLNEKVILPKKKPLFGIKILSQILFVKNKPFKKKLALLKAINIHAVNRYKLVKPGRSEVVLFVIDPNFQGMGIGKHLLNDFLLQCKTSGVASVIVETNTLGACDFYKKMGFKLLDYFDSPLHRYATPDGKACMYENNL